MPRLLREPPFPETPGQWLWCYRYRGIAGHGRLSAEQLGDLLNVSGSTVRRWESGQIRPTREDLRRFSAVCGLTPLESEFILRCFGSVDSEAPPSEEAFGQLLERCLTSALPWFVMDSLFYIRGWNSQLIALSNRGPAEPASDHAIGGLFDPGRAVRRDPILEDPFTPWLRSFWFQTAELCGTEPYVRLLKALRSVGDFEERWWDLALTQSLADVPVNLPLIYHSPNHGDFRVSMTPVTLPPKYYVREYVPIDYRARTFVSERQSAGAQTIGRTVHSHWAEEPMAD